jgi:hypothetical protein
MFASAECRIGLLKAMMRLTQYVRNPLADAATIVVDQTASATTSSNDCGCQPKRAHGLCQ